MKAYKRMAGMICIAMAVMLLLPAHALAAGNIDLTRGCRLTLSYQDNGAPLSGAGFSIYLVATADEAGRLTVTQDFAGFHVKIRGENNDAWKALASTLEGYVLRDRIPSTDAGTTDSQGALSFPTGEKPLTPGLYLVLGSRHIQNGVLYDSQPFMAMLPALNEESDDWEYLAAASPKFNAHREPESSSTVDLRVLKIWQDEGYELERPQSVTVQLLQNGAAVDSVTLSAANGWGHTWKNLDGGSQWLVVEEEEPGYTVEITRQGATLMVVNTATTAIPDEPVPEGPGTPADPDKPKDDLDIPDEDVPLAFLPQTGQLWWPVPLLLCGGLLMIVFGLFRRREV